MKKGNQVKLIGKYPYCGRDGIVKYCWEKMFRHVTEKEVQAWRDSPESKGIDCAGETKLPPTCTGVDYEGGAIYRPELKINKDEEIKLSDDMFTVVRARCAPRLSYRKWKGMTLLQNNRTGEEGYIKTEYIQVIK